MGANSCKGQSSCKSAQHDCKGQNACKGDRMLQQDNSSPEAIDWRAGGIAVSAETQWQWGDAENAMNYWSQRIATRLSELQRCSAASVAQ